jgi:hypothetical protein
MTLTHLGAIWGHNVADRSDRPHLPGMSKGFRPLVTLLAAIAFLLLAVRHEWLPGRVLPHTSLHVDDPPGPFDRLKLSRLDGAECLAALRAANVEFDRVPDRAPIDGCGLTNAVRVRSLPTRLEPPVVLSCRTALSLTLWERRVLQRESIGRFDRRVTALGHYGGPACRNVGGRASGRRSRHATADALDLVAVKLEDGTRLTVQRDWAGDPAHADFLFALHGGACRWFDAVLGPEYDAAHRDHLHLERGGFRYCR